MSKHTNKFIDQFNKGDKFYLAVFTRGYGDVWIGEVEFQSKAMNSRKYLYSEPRMSDCYITEYFYTLKLKSGKDQFSIKFQDFGWGNDNYIQSNNIEFSGAELLLSGFYVADCYMTTDKEAFKEFVNKEELLEKSIGVLEKKKKSIDQKLETLYAFRAGTIG